MADEQKAAPAAAPRKPAYVLILKPWRTHPADKVFAASDDLIAGLAADGVPYREATEFERRIGGFPD